MTKQIIAMALLAALTACSSSGGDSGSSTTGGNTTGSNTTGGNTGVVGVWTGNAGFGNGTMVIDSTQSAYAISSNGAGGYEAVSGSISGALNRFLHRDSENPASADSYTLVGDVPSTLTPATADTVTYSLSANSDGTQLTNSAGGAFTLAAAGTSQVAAITVNGIAGSWRAQTSFCPASCDLTLLLNFDGSGGVTGSTQFNATAALPLSGSVTASSDSNQYLSISFNWNAQTRSGVVYQDTASGKLVLHSTGVDGVNGLRSFNATLTRQ